jgi:hypothetical protein
MNQIYFRVLISFGIILGISGCIGSKLGSAKKNERVTMTAPPKRDVINYALLKKQQEQPLTLASRGSSNSRGAETAFTGSLVSLGVAAVKSVIANEHKKYISEWKQGLNDLYFYDQPSSEGPFDPTGMQFNGFNITRTFKDHDNKIVTAISADFEVDKDSAPSNEIINDAVFRLKLKDIKVNYSKAKVPVGKDTINIDFDIMFITSYISKDGQMFKDMELGTFSLNLRKAPLDSTKAGYKEYYDRLKNKRLDGKCFIVPRSYGHYKTSDTTVIALYNQGMFSIAVNVKECSKNSFVNEMLIRTSDASISYGQSVLMNQIKNKLGNR